ncbi:hypothetical protein [Helicobacter marmotae]|uniref:Autotransporter domain-containing protein n=1 Tax=Helicobacter marmotae TaxID=152490 RepID=A0A3D8I132_9HELI|nr:hypothetical protein [Helicobacter marmotae]RDU58832.1 hypothetical protein CQA63_09110 [Helicobacter marmotae]
MDAEVRLGATFYNIFRNSYISPEFGMGYGVFYLNGFTLKYNSTYAQDETYPDHIFGIPSFSYSVKYLKAFSGRARYNFSIGGRHTPHIAQKATIQIGSHTASSNFYLPVFMGTAGAGWNHSIGKSAEISAQYNGSYSSEQISHIFSLKLAMWF